MARQFPVSLSVQSGFTLIEIVMTIILLSASIMVLVPFFEAISHSPDPLIRQRAVALGQSMMDEILAKKWDENASAGGGPIVTGETGAGAARMVAYESSHPGYSPGTATVTASIGPDSSEGRATYNDVDDYDGSSEADSSFLDQNGAGFAMSGYQRTVAVCYIPSNSSPIDHDTACAAGSTDSKLIVVTVISPTTEVFRFTAVQCNL